MSEDVLERARDYTVTMGDHWKNGEVHDLVCDLAAEVRALRADLIWAVDHGASGGYDGNSDPCIWYSVERTDKYDHNRKLETAATDGTHEDRLRAVREARTDVEPIGEGEGE